MAKAKKGFKRTNQVETHYNKEHEKVEKVSKILSKNLLYVLIAVLVLSFVFLMLPTVGIEIDFSSQSDMIKNMLKGYDNTLNMNAPTIFASAFSGAYTVLDYIVENIPALKKVQEMGQSAMIFSQVTLEQEKLINGGYVLLFILNLLAVIAFLYLLAIAIISLSNRNKINVKLINISLLSYFGIIFLNFVATLIFYSQGTSLIILNIGLGMWLNLLLALIALTYIFVQIGFSKKNNKFNNKLAEKNSQQNN